MYLSLIHPTSIYPSANIHSPSFMHILQHWPIHAMSILNPSSVPFITHPSNHPPTCHPSDISFSFVQHISFIRYPFTHLSSIIHSSSIYPPIIHHRSIHWPIYVPIHSSIIHPSPSIIHPSIIYPFINPSTHPLIHSPIMHLSVHHPFIHLYFYDIYLSFPLFWNK